MPNALTALLAIGSAALALSFFAVLIHVARTQQPPAPPSTAFPSLRNASRAAAAKCSALPTRELCDAAPQRCGWQPQARACVRSMPTKPSRRASKGGGGKNKGAAVLAQRRP
ncbi:hypothetical protein AB1Y20_019478 [Prymnesium parvum]|uniref:Uncharacterized protein n=1 Tax=Prymnesium parvum TaxID=97485 RepID=A0AB34JUK4_PRYPA|mmetsp:Transcript_10591/g.26283  ORF Transcript_10591/g.26283 Transcript_10591/m.26283 type:complete len:112 (-) Transcript_10591:328-663(-)